MELKLKKFDMAMIQDDAVVVMLGKRGCGKSFILKSLLSHKTNMPLGLVISPTEEANGFFGEFVPSIFLHDEYETKTIGNLISRQKKVMKEIKSEKQLYGNCNIDPRAFLVLDDCMYNASAWAKDTNIRYIVLNGRHIKVLTCITLQYGLGLPPTIRSNIDYIFILRENVLRNRKVIFESFAGMFQSFELFCTVLDQSTNNFECLVVCNCSRSNKLEDQVYWYKAPAETPPFKMCDERYWALDRQCTNNKKADEDDDEIFDLDKLRKGRKMNIRVVKN